jgi:hypothetical protein
MKAHPELLSRQPLFKLMLKGLDEREADAVARVLEILVTKRGNAAPEAPAARR